MRRRTVLYQFLNAVAAIPLFRGVQSWAQTPTAQTSSFPGAHESTLKELAAVVLPESLGRKGSDEVSAEFIRWVREYRPGAEMQNGYGVTRVRVEPPSPVSKYLSQLAELSSSVLADGDLDLRRKQLAARLKTAGIRDLPGLPETGDIVVDLMAFYYTSTQANDLAYEAAIERDRCRGLNRSGEMPAPLQRTS